jgi:hypothetical protein
MTDTFRAMCAELIDALDSGIPAGRIRMSPLADRARALLAQPVVEGPTDEELVNFRNRATADCCASRSNNGANLLSGDDLVACQAAGLRAVLAKYGSTTPQLVAEGPTDEEIMELMPQQMRDDLAAAARALAGFDRANVKAAGAMRIILNRHAVDHARAVLAKWGHQ